MSRGSAERVPRAVGILQPPAPLKDRIDAVPGALAVRERLPLAESRGFARFFSALDR